MKIIWRVILIAIAAGIILSILGLSMGASNSLYLDRRGVHTTGNVISHIKEPDLESFNSIYIESGFCDVEFINSDNYGIDLYGNNMEWSWSIDEGMLKITHNDSARLQINFGFMSFERNYAKVYFPANTVFRSVTIKSSSGDVKIGGYEAHEQDISNAFGDVEMSNIYGSNIKVELNSGNFKGTSIDTQILTYNNRFGDGRFQSVNASYLITDSNSGNISLIDCVFDDMNLKNSFGDITARNVTSAKSMLRVNSGDIKIAGDFTGSTVIHADFGDIRFSTSLAREDYSYDISVRFGDITFDGDRMRNSSTIMSGSTGENDLKITSSSGDVFIEFGK